MIELNGIQLDKTSAVPLYEQLRKALLEAITSGKLSAGTKLPTEEELCAQFGISRPVARQAYNMLIEDGFVERMRGRGTFVRSPDTRGRFLNKQLSFAAEMGGFESGAPYRGAACRVGKLYPGAFCTAQARTRGSLLPSCAYALRQRKALCSRGKLCAGICVSRY